MSNDAFTSLGLPALGALLALLCLWFALGAGRRRRLVDNLPTSKSTGVFIGLVELKGTAEAEHPLVSYLGETPCVHYAYTVEEHWSRTVTETYTDSQGKQQTRTRHESGWTTVASGGEQITFYLQDDCGIVLIRPDHADVEPLPVFEETCGPHNPLYYGKGPLQAVSDSDHQRRFHETGVPLHAAIYVVGSARERADLVAPEIAYERHAPLFLISTRSEKQVSRGYSAHFWCLSVLGLLLCAGAWILRGQQLHSGQARDIGVFIAVGAGYLAAWLLGWSWMVYNSMVDLRQRVRQAWANVDVQLKRRNDLIPNLVRAIEGLRDYERAVQTELAELRNQLLVTAPGQPGPDPAGCVVHINAVVERYPELRANGAFVNLQQNLRDTEQRIALARGYFNEIATFYNTRLEIVPDRCIAALSALKPQPLITATDFERAAVQVNLAPRAVPAMVARVLP